MRIALEDFILHLATERGLSENYQLSTRLSLEGLITWLEEQAELLQSRADDSASAKRSGTRTESGGGKKKLSYLEAREFATIEERVEKSDARLAAAHERVEDPAIASDAAALEEALRELANAQQESHDLYARWAELSEKAG